MLENAVENIGILEKSGVFDYTPFGMSMPERSWSLPDDCNTYTSLYYDNMLDIDCFVDCGTWTTFGSRTYLNCNTSSGYLQIGIYGNYRGAYTEFDTETDSTYVVDINITGYNTMATWQVSARDNQGNIIASSMVSQTGPMSFEFTATGSVSRVYVMRVTSYYTFASIALSAVSVTGKYHKEDVMYLSYRYGFNNMEKDDELKGLGNSYDFGARIYDPRVGRWFSRDFYSTFNVNHSPYSFCLNSPIALVDVDGDLNTIYIYVAQYYQCNGKIVKLSDKQIDEIKNAIIKEFYLSELCYYTQIVFVSEPMETKYLDPSDVSVQITSVESLNQYFNLSEIESDYDQDSYGNEPSNTDQHVGVYIPAPNYLSFNRIDFIAYINIHEVIHRYTRLAKQLGYSHAKMERTHSFHLKEVENFIQDHEFSEPNAMYSGDALIANYGIKTQEYPRNLTDTRREFLWHYFGWYVDYNGVMPSDNATQRKKDETAKDTRDGNVVRNKTRKKQNVPMY